MTKKTKSIRAKRKIIIESLFVFFIAISPILYKLYDFLPENPEATISFLGFTIDNNGFQDVSTYAWFMMSKLVPLYLMVFWFMTSKNWWYHIILIPIAMYSMQVFEVFFDSDNTIDTENIWWLLPICMVVIPTVYIVRIKLYDRYVNGIDLEAMEMELNELKQKQHKETVTVESQPEIITYHSISDWINHKFSTDNLGAKLKELQNSFIQTLIH